MLERDLERMRFASRWRLAALYPGLSTQRLDTGRELDDERLDSHRRNGCLVRRDENAT